MKKNWRIMQKKVDFNLLAEKLGVSPYIVRILCNKDLQTEEEMRYFLFGTIEQLHDPYQLFDAQNAMTILWQKIREGKKIRVIGDYDVDGVTSTHILMLGISVLGGNVSGDIPERMRDGYGLNERLIKEAIEDQVDTIITCDNGIAAKAEIALAKQMGLTVLVTDHHEVPYEEVNGQRVEILPDADAIVDPKRKDDTYPYKEICGAVVALKCMQILFDLAKDQQVISQTIETNTFEEMLEFAALATVCDVMPLLDENRILVKEGLSRMENSQNVGLRALIECADLLGKRLTVRHLGFQIGPCVNSMGRLETAKKALDLFEEKNFEKAMQVASELVELNSVRKTMTEEATAKAIQIVEEGMMEDTVLVVYLEDCHESLAGIIAGRVREKFNKPCLVVTKTQEGLKGSGRSIEAYHMRDGLQGVQELLTKFGGHKLAAGFSLEEENLDALRKKLNEKSTLTEKDLEKQIMLDINLPIEYATLDFVNELEILQPFGMKNEAPLFGRNDLTVKNMLVVGENRNVLKCKLQAANGKVADGIVFQDVMQFEEAMKQNPKKMLLAYYPQINEYRGERSVQLVIKEYEIVE